MTHSAGSFALDPPGREAEKLEGPDIVEQGHGAENLWPNSPDHLSSHFNPSLAELGDESNGRFDVGGVNSFLDDNSAISHMHMSGLSRTGVTMRWETPLMRQILGDPCPGPSLNMPLNWGHIPAFGPEAVSVEEPAILSSTRWTCAKHVKHTSDKLICSRETGP